MSILGERSGLIQKKKALSGTEIRKRMGFPQNANRWVSLLVYPALTPMLALRRKVGVRMVSFSRLVGAYLIMLAWGLLIGGIYAAIYTLKTQELPSISDVVQGMVADQVRAQIKPLIGWLPESVRGAFAAPNEPPVTYRAAFEAFTSKFSGLFLPMFVFGLLTVSLGIVHRIIRWIRRQAGEQLNTKSLGVSLIPLPIKNNSIERYLDPLLCFGAGYFTLISGWPLVGAWIIFCAFSLAAVEKYVHEIQLDQYDALLNAEAHEQITGKYLSGMQRGGRGTKSTKPVATGMSKDVRERMAKRLRHQSQPLLAVAPTDAPSVTKIDAGKPRQLFRRK